MTKNITELLPLRCKHSYEKEARKAKDIDLEQYFNCILCSGYNTKCPKYEVWSEGEK